MKFPKLLLRFTFFSTCMTTARCGSYSSPEPEYFSSVKYQTKEKSKQFSSCVKNIHVDTTDYKLRVKFDIKCPKDFPFPIIDSMKDTLTSTAFKFEFLSPDGYREKPITLDRAIVFPSNDGSRSGYYWWGTEINSTLAFKNDTASLRKIYSVQAVIPFYAFQHLKAGKQNIEVKISQSTFCSDLEQSVKHWNEALQDSCYYTFKNYSAKSLISGTLSFSINVP